MSDRALARSTAAMTVATAVSRSTGFARIVVVAAVLGTTFLGNTYQSANTVPNILFELLAAGSLQAVLVPSLVEALRRGGHDEAEHVAGAIFGLLGAVLASVAAVGMVTSPWIMRGLVGGVSDPATQADQIRLGTVFLLIFLPQVVFYAAGMVATASLNAQDRFVLPVAAPIVNNVVVISAYVGFWWLRDGAPPSLDLTPLQVAVLAGGTTAGVVGFTAVPMVALWRSGFRVRPSLDRHHPLVHRVVRSAGWAGMYLAMTQVLLLAVIILANPVEGGVVVFQVALAFFLLPHALFSLPVLTTLFPRMSRQNLDGDTRGYARSVDQGVRMIALLTVPVIVLFMTLAHPVMRLVLFGETGGGDADAVGDVLVAMAPGVVGFGVQLFLTRAFYALDDARTPALVNTAGAVLGLAVMVTASLTLDGTGRVVGLGAAYGGAQIVGAIVAYTILAQRMAPGHRPRVATGLVRTAGAGLATGAAALGVRTWLSLDGRVGAGVVVMLGGLAGYAVFFAVQALVGGLTPFDALRLIRGRVAGEDRAG